MSERNRNQVRRHDDEPKRRRHRHGGRQAEDPQPEGRHALQVVLYATDHWVEDRDQRCADPARPEQRSGCIQARTDRANTPQETADEKVVRVSGQLGHHHRARHVAAKAPQFTQRLS